MHGTAAHQPQGLLLLLDTGPPTASLWYILRHCWCLCTALCCVSIVRCHGMLSLSAALLCRAVLTFIQCTLCSARHHIPMLLLLLVCLFAPDVCGYKCCEAPQCLAFCVNNVPVLGHIGCVCT
jgi:hypothetical protein